MKHSALTVFGSLLLVIVQWATTANGQQNSSVISCEVEVCNVGADIEINGFPFWQVDLAKGVRSTTGRISHLVCKGTNVVTLSFTSANGGEVDTNEVTGASFSVEIAHTTLSNSIVVARDILLLSKGYEANTQCYFVVSEYAVLDQPWLLPPPVLASSDRHSISSVVANLHVALAGKDMLPLREVFRQKNELCAVSAGISLAEMEVEQATFFTNLFAGATYSVMPLDTSSLTYTVSSNANLVSVTGPNNSIPIAIQLGDDTTLKMPLLFSKTTNGVWVIVR